MCKVSLFTTIVSAPHATHKSLKSDDDREWVIGNRDRLILIGKR